MIITNRFSYCQLEDFQMLASSREAAKLPNMQVWNQLVTLQRSSSYQTVTHF